MGDKGKGKEVMRGGGPENEEDRTNPAYIRPKPLNLPPLPPLPPTSMFGNFTFPPPMTPPGPLSFPALPPSYSGPAHPPPPPLAPVAYSGPAHPSPPHLAPVAYSGPAPPQPPPLAPVAYSGSARPQLPPLASVVSLPPLSAPVAGPRPLTPDPTGRSSVIGRPLTPPDSIHPLTTAPGPWDSPLDPPSRSGSFESSRSGSLRSGSLRSGSLRSGSFALSRPPSFSLFDPRTIPLPPSPDRRLSIELATSRRPSDIVSPPPASSIRKLPSCQQLISCLPPACLPDDEEPPSGPAEPPPMHPEKIQGIINGANYYLTKDTFEETSREIRTLLREGNWVELESRLNGRLTFGTAGLRAPLGAGWTRMNRMTVILASQGLAAYLLQKVPDAATRGVVVGHDARRQGEFLARLTATTIMNRGIKVYWFDQRIHTPLVPFAIQELGAAAGVMVTASHNPRADQGYKVYWENACQIVSGIAEGIAHAMSLEWTPERENWNLSLGLTPKLFELKLEKELVRRYYDRVFEYVNFPEDTIVLSAPFVYTPLHGVGLKYFDHLVCRLTRRDNPWGLYLVVEEQRHPDGEFPTLPNPNPEEHGVLDLAKQLAHENNIPLIIANDPDADRLAVAEHQPNGTFYQFTGNEIGILLAAYVLQRQLSVPPSKEEKRPYAMMCSTVSTGMLRKMCDDHNIKHIETLTGFKWLGTIAKEASSSYRVLFAFEEALGYMFPSILYDKDGVSAACVILRAAGQWIRDEGLNLAGKLAQLRALHGHYADANTYLTSPSPDVTRKVFAGIRATYKTKLELFDKATIGAHLLIDTWRDLTQGFDTTTRDHKPLLPVDPSSEMITCTVAGRWRITMRGSGTEPKIKLYVEAVGRDMGDASAAAKYMQDLLIEQWFQPERWGLTLPPGYVKTIGPERRMSSFKGL